MMLYYTWESETPFVSEWGLSLSLSFYYKNLPPRRDVGEIKTVRKRSIRKQERTSTWSMSHLSSGFALIGTTLASFSKVGKWL